MWNLNVLDKKAEQDYLNILFDKVKKKRDAIEIDDIKNYLTDSKLEELLISQPKELYLRIDEYKREIFRSEFDKWLEDSKKRTNEQQSLVDKYKSAINVFDYKGLISSKKNVSYKIANLIGVNTCVYCNRQYIFTVDKNDEHITRPEFDHYLPQSIYPFFALSLYNLIPSCHICNSNCKGEKEFAADMNPYEKKMDFKFTYHIKENGYPSAVLLNNDIPKTKKYQNVREFVAKIQEIYNYHTDLELKELYEFATKYSNTYLKDVLGDMGINLRVSQEEAYRILFGAELLEDKDNNRPFSKFKRDILKELGIIK
ncbi:hypothetical protein AGMMS49965_16190 [Bacteroidia bacterium]|nr:hypothetical protein AGMMS49965_16190 [Bacteroidia bacterium]